MKPKVSEWEGEIKNEDSPIGECVCGCIADDWLTEKYDKNCETLITFIQSLLDTQKQELVEMLKPAFEEWAGNSQYVTGSWTTGDYVEEERNDDYWNYRRKNAWEQFSTTLDDIINKLEER